MVTMSTTEAEYCALSEVAKKLFFLVRIITKVRIMRKRTNVTF